MDKISKKWRQCYICGYQLILFFAMCLPVVNSYGQQVEYEDKGYIKVGISTVLSGPTQSLGSNMKLGIETYFRRISLRKEIILKKYKTIAITNKDGKKEFVPKHIATYFKKVKLIAKDDGYKPESARENINLLADQDGVLAFIGNGGTATVDAALPVVKKKERLLFAPHTGASFLRSTPLRYVINYRPSYAREIDEMIKWLKEANIHPFEIALFTQNDPYGDEGYEGAVKALKTHFNFTKKEILTHARYKRDTREVEDAVLKIVNAKYQPKAIIMVGTPAPCAKFIKILSESDKFSHTIFLSVSIGSEKLAKLLGGKCERVIVTQVVPHYNSNFSICRNYKKDLEKYSPGSKPGFVSFEGYVAAKIFCEGLKRAYFRDKLNREGIIDAIESIKNLDIGLGAKINYSSQYHQAIDKVWATVIQGNKLKPFKWENLPKLFDGTYSQAKK